MMAITTSNSIRVKADLGDLVDLADMKGTPKIVTDRIMA
jgi:hypothetical protein